ncbi:MAG TPA: choloylglycine hydrolase [Microscillaceae bacterium]|nr:choloylglycine hydrolase [Microscillaceae bacterium]
MCTNFTLTTTKNQVVNGRSMEFGTDLGSQFFFRKAGHDYKGILNEFGAEYSWTGKYAFVCMNASRLPFGKYLATDGINTQGLSTGSLWLPGSQYQNITDKKKELPVELFCNWVLSQFATCEEVKKAVLSGEVQVKGLTLGKDQLMPVHFPVQDAQGNSIVIEYIDGEPHVHDNPVGVLTNDPPFEWHVTNLRNYVNINSEDFESAEFERVQYLQTGHGTGFSGIPGDSTPPSRFVRAAMMKNFITPVETLDEAVISAFHILNTVDIPQGTSKSSKNGKVAYDVTQWAVVKDLERKIYYARFYGSPQVYSVDLNKIDFDQMDGKMIAIPDSPISIDLTDKAKEKELLETNLS